jgi:NitT/TauT family transport system ATP-binding protein
MTKSISVKNLSKTYGKHNIISNISFEVEKGEIVTIFGPNGSGKSTLLNILSGLENEFGGTVKIQDFSKKEFSYIFQNYRESLLPWKNNFDNVAFPLNINGMPNELIINKINEMSELFDFKKQINKYPYQLSGGQQQVIGFMRALITNPKILFIDEPFSALDYENNLLLREHLLDYHKKYSPTILAVTHNIEEAIFIGNKIIVLSKNPTKIVKIIKNNEKFPRDTKFLKSKKFFRLKNEVLDAFEKGC